MRERLDDWERFVESLASPEGYPDELCLDDYYQDLVNRDFLEGLKTSAELRKRVLAADETFRANTFESAETRLSGAYWWHMRLPQRAGDDLKDEAKGLGFLDEALADGW